MTVSQSELNQIRIQFPKYGDVPVDEARSATQPSKAKDWVCVSKNGKVIAAGRVVKSDWYEYTLKNGYVVPKYRGRGIGNQLYKKMMDDAKQKQALVVQADITSTNVTSKVAARKIGMHSVLGFKWSDSEPHADVFMKSLNPPTKQQVIKQNQYVAEQLKKQNKPIDPGMMTPHVTDKKVKGKIKFKKVRFPFIGEM